MTAKDETSTEVIDQISQKIELMTRQLLERAELSASEKAQLEDLLQRLSASQNNLEK